MGRGMLVFIIFWEYSGGSKSKKTNNKKQTIIMPLSAHTERSISSLFEYDIHNGGELSPTSNRSSSRSRSHMRMSDDEVDRRYCVSPRRRRSQSPSPRKYQGRDSRKFPSRELFERVGSEVFDRIGAQTNTIVLESHKLSDTFSERTLPHATSTSTKGGTEIDAYGLHVDDGSEEIYIVKQRYGYLSIVFSLAQTAVLATMMVQCGIAPLTINPMFGPYPDALSEWGGKNSINIIEDGEMWRLLTPLMLHAGVIHLLCNISVQIELGVFFEREWGSFIWLTIYLVSAIGASVLSVIFMPNAVSVGSSGAVMGLFGGKLAEVICRVCERDETTQQRVGHQVRKEQCAGVMCSVIVVMAFSFIPYVDWAAHLGGLVSGLTMGLICFSMEIENICLRLLWFGVGVVTTILYFLISMQIMYSGQLEVAEDLRDVCGYYQQFFDDYECNCMREEYNWANRGGGE